MREMMVIVSWNFCTTCVLYISVMLRRRFPACSWFVLCILRFYLTNQEENGSKQDSRKSVWSRRRWSVSPTALTENNTDLIWPAEFQSSPTTRTLWTPRGLRKRWEISNAAGLIFFFPRLLFFPPSGRVCWLMHSAETDRLLQRRSLSHPGVDLSHASSALSFAKACMHVHPFPRCTACELFWHFGPDWGRECVLGISLSKISSGLTDIREICSEISSSPICPW